MSQFQEHIFGQTTNEKTRLTCYLPTPPSLPYGFNSLPELSQHPDSIALCIEQNGNHWRKILIILAKLAAAIHYQHIPNEKEWKHYRDHFLLQDGLANISFSDAFEAHEGWHLISGQAHWTNLKLNKNKTINNNQFELINEKYLCYKTSTDTNKNVLLGPYLDYRQFPNVLIAQCQSIFLVS